MSVDMKIDWTELLVSFQETVSSPVDIANFCAFLLARGFTYKAPKQA